MINKLIVHCIMTLSFMASSNIKLKAYLLRLRTYHLSMKFHETCSSITCTQYILDVTHTCQAQTKFYAQMLYQCVISFIWARPTNLVEGPQIFFYRKISKKSGKVGSSKYANVLFKEFGTQLLPLHFIKVHSSSRF